ncbi:MAG: hypothetical protein Nkreftii_002331 [Candidatus Nitrospira kreftii]|jgi:uncharacterized membrane protein YtjA (UPF0391 family)|uniref:Uncharacterized protein n=1 Tax=Candidatus Nitrospira kreftii TaxID=2652173 RepID=A0A7S8FET2_9BACT|nr:MAG: hypothetical protein Nkreftii_002331 [Candidatus Nitrospira kreftii]
MRRPLLIYWSWVFLGLSVVAIALALTDVAGSRTGMAYVLFIIFFLAYLVSFFWGRRPPPLS